MTMPSLINNARKSVLEAGLKKAASIIGQAFNMYQAQNGERLKPGMVAGNMLKGNIIKYFNVAVDCSYGYNDDKACIRIFSDDGSKDSKVYKNFNGTSLIDLSFFDNGQFVLADGSLVLIENNHYVDVENLYISVDVNGYNKKPNRLGQDLFMFQLDKNGHVLPMGTKATTYYSENDSYCSKTSTNPMNGAGCTYKA